MKGHLKVLGYNERESLERDIREALWMCFEWMGDWKPAYPAAVVRVQRGITYVYLTPQLWSICGAPIPENIPVKMKPTDDPLMSLITQFYRKRYRVAPAQDRLAAFAAKMVSDEEKRPRKGRKKPC